MAVLLRMFEACLLITMGAFMAALSQSSMYWQFLNPRYAWLTLVTGAVLAVIGLSCLFNTDRKPRASEICGVLAFLILVLTAFSTTPFLTDEQSFSAGGLTNESPAPFGGLTRESPVGPPPTVVIDGVPYVRINVGELLVGEPAGRIKPGQAYAIQGEVQRTEELDQAGYIGVGRLVVQCCFADSIGVATLVKVQDPRAYKAGAWVHVAGVIEEGAPFPENAIRLKGALTVLRSERFSLRAVNVSETKVVGVPFIFEIRDEPPFAY